MANGHVTSMEIGEDELLCELDVHLARSKQSLYLFQYPIRPHYQPYDETSFTSARIKEKYALVEIDQFIDSQSTNYYGARGKQLASDDSNQTGHSKFFHSDQMDKQTLSSTTTSPGMSK